MATTSNTVLYVKNIPRARRDEKLMEIFGQYGNLVPATEVNDSATGKIRKTGTMVALDRRTGRSNGYAFVEFVDAEGAAKAVEATNGQEFDGRPIYVNFKEEKSEEEKRVAREERNARFGDDRGYNGWGNWGYNNNRSNDRSSGGYSTSRNDNY